MQKSTIPFLLISFFLAIALTSCASSVVKDYSPVNLDKKTFENPYFADSAKDYVYKANITVYGNQISGIFIAKKLNDTAHRVVFATEFGNKLLDFEISEKEFKVNSIVEELDRKIIVNTLKNDFRLLLRKEYLLVEKLENKEVTVYQSKIGNKFNYFFVSKKNGKFYKIVQSVRKKEKISIYFTSENNIFAERVVIQHTGIKLKIEFNYLKEELN